MHAVVVLNDSKCLDLDLMTLGAIVTEISRCRM